MTMVDTGAWFALLIPTDPDHQAVDAWMKSYQGDLLTTDFIIDETLTLLLARGHKQRAVHWGEKVFAGKLGRIHFVTEDEVVEAWNVFRTYLDKGWSFTDCVSYVVIRAHGIQHALSLDHHFQQFGNVTIVPA